MILLNPVLYFFIILLQLHVILIFKCTTHALLFCNETDVSDLRLVFDKELLKYQNVTNPNVFILNSTAWGSAFNVTCAARRAVNWRFDGLTANSLVTIDRYRNHNTTCHLISLNFTAIDEQVTGTYSCYEIGRTWRSINFTLFTGHSDARNFLRLHGRTIDVQPMFGNSSVFFPCGLNNPRANVTLFAMEPKINELKVIANSMSLEFNPVQGFTVNITENKRTKYKCIALVDEGDQTHKNNQTRRDSDFVNFNYRNHEGPTFVPDTGTIILPSNATTYKIQCIAPYPIYITTDGPLTFHISNDTIVHPGISSVFALFKPNSSSPGLLPSSTNVSCHMHKNNTLIKSWNVQLSESDFQPGLYFDQSSATATCFSSTVHEMEIFQVSCETDTECELQRQCLTEEEDWKCPGSPDGTSRRPNIVAQNETSVTVELGNRSSVLSCRSTDVNSMISFHVKVDGELALDSDIKDAALVEILGPRSVSAYGVITAQCTASRRLYFSKLNFELWNRGKFLAYVTQDMVLHDEFMEIPGLFIRTITFRFPPGEYDAIVCFVETYAPRYGFVKGTPLTVYQNNDLPAVNGPKFVSLHLTDANFPTNKNLTCEAENWSNISWEIPPNVQFSDLIMGEVSNLSETRSVSEIFIPELNPKYEGIYTCILVNRFGVTQKEFTVHVEEEKKVKLPWLFIAIVAGIIFGFEALVCIIWWIVRNVRIATFAMQGQQDSEQQQTPHQLAAGKPAKSDAEDELIQLILRQFHEGILPLTSAEKDVLNLQNEHDGNGEAARTETGNYAAGTIPYDFAHYEIPAENVEIDAGQVLGSGEFGIVHGGKLRLNGGQESVQVAIKRLKYEADSDYISSFLKELQVLIYVGKHTNVIELLGACTKSKSIENIFFVLKLCANGSLEKYLRTRRKVFIDQIGENGAIINDASSVPKSKPNYTHVHHSINTQDLLRWTIQISSGMEFLAEKKVIHGDLACRNVLLDENLIVKISDFGFARRLYEYAKYIKKEQGLLPWRWMAIESLQDLHFSPASDVWAFGITAWEIFTLSEIPYPGIVWSLQFVEQLLAGHRNVKPKYATKEIFSILKTCWHQDPVERPTMSQLKDNLSSLFAKDFISSSTDYIKL